MAVFRYWRERLIDRCPIDSETYWVMKVTYRPRLDNPVDRWPRAIARSSMYDDYGAWCKRQEVEKASELVFFSTLSPWVYIKGKKYQVRSYPIPQLIHHAGSWNEGKVTRYFIRLGGWEEHVAAFQIDTGMDILTPISQRDPMAGDRIESALRERMGLKSFQEPLHVGQSQVAVA